MNYRYLLIIILSIFLVPTTVSAKEYLDIDCKKNNKLYQCDITLNYDEEVSAVEYTYTLPKNVSFKEFINSYSWEGTCDNNVLSLYTDGNKIGSIKLGTLILSSKKDIKSEDIETSKLLIYDSSFEEVELINNVKNNENKVKKSNSWIYIIVSCVIIFIVIVLFLFKKKKGDAK